jgi:ATP phosphoribosyltransferase regulatory subunit
MKNKLLHTPVGVRDIYGKECLEKVTIERKILNIFSSYGYRHIQTPTFEFFDIFNSEREEVFRRKICINFLTGQKYTSFKT